MQQPFDMGPLLQAFIGQTQQATAPVAPAQEGSPWQQELLETVNPQKVRQQNIRRAMATAAQALATTPGNFLQGVSAAASTGANAYLNGQEQAQARRAQVMQQIDQAQSRDRDERLSKLAAAIGIGRGIQNDQYGRQRDAVSDQRYTDETKYRRDQDVLDRKDRRLTRAYNDMLSQSQTLTTKRAIRSELRTLETQLKEEAKYNEAMTPQAVQAQIDQRRAELEEYYGISLDDSIDASASPQVVKPDASSALQEARDALAKGADPAAVRQRLIDNGYDASGL
jgi:hypothetical protein